MNDRRSTKGPMTATQKQHGPAEEEMRGNGLQLGGHLRVLLMALIIFALLDMGEAADGAEPGASNG